MFVAVALSIPALITISRTQRGLGDRLILAVIVLACTATAAWRMFRALRQHARAESRLAHQATHDLLTGLANRTFAHHHLDQLLDHQDSGSVALVFLDLDRFRLINDSLGHGVGDELLGAVGERLEANSRAGDLVARIGGDEFVVVARGLRAPEHARELAERTRLSLAQRFRVRDIEIPISASVGVATHHHDEPPTTAEAMLRDADIAMYQAKDAGGDGISVFDAPMRRRVNDRIQLENELRQALDRGELHLAYQPIVRSQDQRVTSLEALLRWSHPELGEIEPARFIPIAEDTGAIVEIGAWVLDQACADLATLRTQVPYAEDLSVAVNLSVRQLRDNALLDHVARSLLNRGLPASGLRLELTESLVMENLALISKLLGSLRSFGVRISVDDFGTGYSSLSTLDRLPVDEVKIDKSFIDGIADHGANTTLVSAIVAIAESLGHHHRGRGRGTHRAGRAAPGAGLRPGPGLPVLDAGDLRRAAGHAVPAGAGRGAGVERGARRGLSGLQLAARSTMRSPTRSIDQPLRRSVAAASSRRPVRDRHHRLESDALEQDLVGGRIEQGQAGLVVEGVADDRLAGRRVEVAAGLDPRQRRERPAPGTVDQIEHHQVEHGHGPLDALAVGQHVEALVERHGHQSAGGGAPVVAVDARAWPGPTSSPGPRRDLPAAGHLRRRAGPSGGPGRRGS